MKTAIEMREIAQEVKREKALAKQVELEAQAKKGMMCVEICLNAGEIEVLTILRKQGYKTRYKTFIGGKEIYVVDWND